MVGPSATCVRAQNADNLAKGGVGGGGTWGTNSCLHDA